MSLCSWLALAFSMTTATNLALAQKPPCDDGLRGSAANAYAYKPRGDRCEGVYIKQVGGTAMAVASLTADFEEYDPDSVRQLILAWSSPVEGDVRIRVRGIQPNLYYGMDAAPSGNLRSYSWPASVLSSLRIGRRDIGALAWTRREIGGSWRNVYLPLSISSSDRTSSRSGYALVVFPGVKLKEVYLTLGPADSSGRPPPASRLIRNDQPQNQGFYPAERPIRIKLPKLDAPGLYYLRVTARLANGSPVGGDPLLIDVSER